MSRRAAASAVRVVGPDVERGPERLEPGGQLVGVDRADGLGHRRDDTADRSAAACEPRCNRVICNHTCRTQQDGAANEMGDMTMDELRGWFAGRIPDEWFTGRSTSPSTARRSSWSGRSRRSRRRRARARPRRPRRASRASTRFREETRAGADAHRRRGPAPVPAPRLVGREARRRDPHLHDRRGAGHDPPADARARASSTRSSTPASRAAGARRSPGASGWSATTRATGSTKLRGRARRRSRGAWRGPEAGRDQN